MNGDNEWLAIIDMQNIFAPPNGWACPRFAEIIEPILALAERHRGRTLLTRFVDARQKKGSWIPYYEQLPFADVPDDDPLYDIVDPLRGLVTPDNVVTMTTFSKWAGISEKIGPYPHLTLAGVATDCCVLSTAISAAEAGAFVTVAMNACAGSSDPNQAAAQAIFEGYAPLIRVDLNTL